MGFLTLQVVDGVHGLFFPKHNPDALMRAFSLLISNGKLSKFAEAVASSGRLLAKKMLASECITGYARLLENVLNFSSDTVLPRPISHLQQGSWEWNLFRDEIQVRTGDMRNIDEKATFLRKFSVVDALEDEFTNFVHSTNVSENRTGILLQDIPTKQDWDVLSEVESTEEYERVEMEEVFSCNYSFCFVSSSPPPPSLEPTKCLHLKSFIQKTAETENCFLICSLKKEWRETLVIGMRFIVMLEDLKNLSLKQMKGMRESLRGQASQCAFMRFTVELGPGHSCTMVLCTVV